MENWLPAVTGIYLLGMVLYGHYKGFIRLAVSMLALILSLTIVRASLPAVTGYLKENTGLQQMISENMKKSIGLEQKAPLTDDESETPSVQRTIIENLNLPQGVKTTLLENNNSEMYRSLGVSAFTDYIGSFMADIILNYAGFAILFAAVYLALKIVVRWLDIISHLPILSGINKITGALLGGVEGLAFVWLACMVITVFSTTAWGLEIFRQIEASKWLTYLYTRNFLKFMVLGVIQGII